MISKNELDVMAFALRYAIGRQTYAPMVVREYIETRIPLMTKGQVKDLIYELERVEPLDAESMKLLKTLWKAETANEEG